MTTTDDTASGSAPTATATAPATPPSLPAFAERLRRHFGDALGDCRLQGGRVNQVTIEVAAERLTATMTALRDEPEFHFEQLIDLAGVDYVAYGKSEWSTEQPTVSGFSRAVNPTSPGRGRDVVRRYASEDSSRRFAVVYQLLSIRHNRRLRVRAYAPSDELPVVPSVTSIWNSADWFEREAFDLYGIVFEGHPDLRRILTDYGFVGHPFRKDFPLIGNVEMRYDAERGRVVYQPVSIEPRVLVPRVIREDHRYVDVAGRAEPAAPKADAGES